MTATATHQPDLLAAAVLALAAQDTDHATEQNGVGYNGTDTGFGNRLAQLPVNRWTRDNRVAAYEMLRKYRKQLAAYGIDYDAIPAEEGPHASRRTLRAQDTFRLDLVDGWFVMAAPYTDGLVERQKAVRGRRYDWDSKTNSFPVTSAVEVARIVTDFNDFDWEITPAAQAALDSIDGDLLTAAEGPRPTLEVCFHPGAAKGQVLEVLFPYDPAMVAACRDIPGRRWDGARKTNTFPLTAASAHGLLQFVAQHGPAHFGPGSESEALEPMLQRVASEGEAQREAAAGLAVLSKAKDASIEIPGLGGELRPFQRAGVQYVIDAGGRAMIGDDMGTGKTVQTLAALLAENAFPALIVCPAVVKLSWREHVRGPAIGAPDGWLPGKTVEVLSGKKPSAQQIAAARRADVLIANWDILSAWQETLESLGLRALVCDESHYAKSRKAARTKAALAIAKTIPADGLVLGLTGTAVLNRPIELAAQLEIIGRLQDFGGFWHFAKRYCGAYRDTWGWQMDGATHLEELNARLRSTCFIRRMKKDVMSELPEKQHARVAVSITNSREYQAAEADVVSFLMDQVESDREFAAEIADLPEDEQRVAISARKLDTAEKTRRAEKLVKLNALRRVVARGKIQAACDWVRDFLDGSDQKLIVFAHHVDIQKALLEEFPGAAHILGEDSDEVRHANEGRFQTSPDCRLVVCSLSAAGIGITLTAASSVAFLELDWTPAKHDQAEDRAHRMGQEGSVVCYYLLAEDTIDDDMYALIESKRAVVSAATDGEASVRDVSVLGELEARILARAGRAPA